MNRLSACLITLNEERNLPRALRSLEGVADEIIVVDCGSQDRTQEIARAYKAKTIIREWTDFAQQKYEAGKRRWRAAMWLATPWTCFSTFVLRGGVLDGSRGWLISRMAARGVWLKFRKLGDLIETERHGRTIEAP